MSNPNGLIVEVITDDKPSDVLQQPAYGHGENAVSTMITGNPTSITIATKKGAKLGLRFHDNGEITLTSYDTSFRMAVPTNVRLESNRDWRQP